VWFRPCSRQFLPALLAGPSAEPAVYTAPRAKAFRQVSPRNSRIQPMMPFNHIQ
jgi:hypothetical protein